MIHENPTASRKFDTDTIRVFTTDGEPDALAFYDPASPSAWLSMNDPLDLHEWR